MVNTMFVLDRTLNTSHILSANKNSQSAFWEDTYTQEFDTGAESFEFSCYTHESIKEGNYVAFFYNNQYKMFQIIEVQEVHKKGRLVSECYCEIASLQLLNNYVKPFSGDMNCIQFFQHILHGTEWHIGKYSTSLENVVYTVNESNIESVWSLIEDYKDIYGCEINVRVTYDNGHVTGQYIDIYAEGGLGSSTLKRFEYGRNVTGITKTKDLYDWCTGIILDVECDVSDTVIEERDGYGFTKGAGDVILDDNANRMYNAGRTHVIGVYQGKETEPIEACINAWKELQKRKEPKFDYKVTTALKDEEYEDIHLGDTVHVVDYSYTPPLLLEARVGKLELSFTDRTQNSCTLTNYKEIKSKLLDADYIKLTGTISDVVNAFFPITSEGIADGAIVDGKIETTYFQQITADIVSAGIGAFENLYTQNMTVINADIESLRAETAEIIHLKSQLAEIDTLINGHLTSDNIQSLILTSDKVTVEDAFIKDAMIDSIAANKITSGSINTNNVYISSEDGSMIINGNLQQFKDKDGNVRIQIGKDSQGDFTFSLFDENGTGVLIDEKGITENAIADGLIVNDMVAEDAGIAGSKLDIDSVVTEINNGTTTIKGTKVMLDENNQTLDVAFNALNTKVDDMEEETTSNTTAINVQQGQIDTLISNTTITKEDGEVVQLKDEYNSTKDTVDSHTTKIGSLETTVNSVSSKQASMELDLNGFRTEVSDTYVTKEELDLTNYNLINNGKFENCYAHTYDMVPSWICDDSLGVWEPRSGGGWRFLNTSSTAGEMKGIRQNPVLEENTTYTLSFRAGWQKNVNQDMEGYINFYDNGWGLLSTITIPITNNESLSDLQIFTFTTPADFVNCEIKFYFGEHVGSDGTYCLSSLYEVKLEKGDTYTGWRGSKKDETITIEGPNLIQNGDFSSFTLPKTIDGWNIGGDGYIWDLTGQGQYNKEGCIYFAHTSLDDVYSGFYQNVRNLKRRTEYTLTFFIDWEPNVRSFYVDLVFIGKDGSKLFGIDLKPSHGGTWSYTFVTPDIDFGHMNVGFCHRGILADTGGAFLGTAGNVKLTEKVVVEDLGTVLSNYTTKTEFQQTNEDFTFRISQAGGGNLLKNSLFKEGKKYWDFYSWDNSSLTNIDSFIWAPNSGDWSHGIRNSFTAYMGVTHGGAPLNCTLSSPLCPVTGNETYSYSFYHRQHRCHAYIEIKGLQYDGNYRTVHAFDLDEIVSGDADDRTFDSWGYSTKTFTIPSDIRAIHLWIVMANHNKEDQLNCYFWLAEPCIVRGSTPVRWVPHESEVYDGIVKIDSQGLTVQHGSNSTVMDSDSFKIKVGSDTHAQIKNGQFSFTDASGSNMLGRLGRSYWEGTGIAMTSLGASYGNTIALSAQHNSGGTYITGAVCSSKEQWIGDSYYYQGLDIATPVVTGRMRFRDDYNNRMQTYDGISIGMLDLWALNDSSWGGYGGMVIGNNYLRLGTYSGSVAKGGIILREDNTQSNGVALHGYGPLNMHGYDITNAGWTNPVSASSEYTYRLLRQGTNEHINYGTLSYYEGEIRWCWKENVFTYQDCDIDPETDEWVYFDRYICYVELPIFIAENIEVDYHINVSKMSWGDWRIREKNQYYFILESQEEDFAFTFEVVAKLKDGATITNNAIIANNSIDTVSSILVPQDTEGAVDPVGSINIQENINTGEE